MAKIKKKEIPPYRGIPCDSYAEVWTLQWLFELKEAGYISRIERSPSYLLFDGQEVSYIKQLKTKGVPMTESLLAPHLYTPDFLIHITEKGKQLDLFHEIGEGKKFRERDMYKIIHTKGIAHIETKGTMFRHSQDTTEKFRVDQKWIWEKHKIYVNLFQPDNVFPKTFTPKEYRKTSTGKDRKMQWKPLTLNTFMLKIKK